MHHTIVRAMQECNEPIVTKDTSCSLRGTGNGTGQYRMDDAASPGILRAADEELAASQLLVDVIVVNPSTTRFLVLAAETNVAVCASREGHNKR